MFGCAAEQPASAPEPEPEPAAAAGPLGGAPEGFTALFNGQDTTGWHISQTNHHGTTPIWKVEDGILTGEQNPPGLGGILLTGKTYRNFEVYIELKPDFGCDGGLFLRSSEKGEAYQVMLDYLEGGAVGGIYGEKLEGVKGGRAEKWKEVWKKDDWNSIRARIEGDVPHIQVWMNGTQIVDWTDTENHAAGGATEGMIAVQVHRGERWVEGGQHRFRVIAVKEL
jgi:hypothetical protein